MSWIRLSIHEDDLESVEIDSFRLPIKIEDEVLILLGNDSKGVQVGRLQRSPDSYHIQKHGYKTKDLPADV